MNNNIFRKTLSVVFVFVFIITSISFAASQIIYDKKGREVVETERPTAESTIDPDHISDALRRKNSDASKNVFSGKTLMPEENIVYDNAISNEKAYTMIKHKSSINHLDDYGYELIEDRKADRLMLKIMSNNTGVFYAKSAFYEINNKTYYFDDDGHMVLGPCKDSTGRTYFFSYETGELLED